MFKAARFLSHLLLILEISLRKVNPGKPLISLEYLYLMPVRIHAGLSEILLNGSGHATPKLALLSVILLLLITAKYKTYINISAPLREQPKCRLAEGAGNPNSRYQRSYLTASPLVYSLRTLCAQCHPGWC